LLQFRTCQEQLTVEHSKNNRSEQEQEQLRHTIQVSNEQLEKVHYDLKQTTIHNEQLEYTINDLNSRNNLIETKLIETMTLIDIRNKTLIDYEQQMDKIKYELIQKHKETLDKQCHIDELEQIVIDKTAEVSELTETLETGLSKTHHREKVADDHATKALHDIKVLQREVKINKEEFF
jgi:hypothetical protein